LPARGLRSVNIAETRSEMLACIAALREQLVGVAQSDQREALAERCRRQIERIRKQFKRKIDKRGASRGLGFSVHEREGIEGELAKTTAAALDSINQAVRLFG
jgi:hypothetical protein